MSTAGRRGPGRPRKLPVDEQRARIIAAARRELAVRGSDGITIEGIARAAELSRQAVYEQFRDRRAVTEAAVADIEENLFAAVGAPARDWADPDLRVWTRAIYTAIFDFVAQNPDALPVLRQADRAGDPTLDRVRERLAEVYAGAVRARGEAHGVHPGPADRALVAMYVGMAEAVIEQEAGREALIDLLTEFTVGGVLRLFGQTPEVLATLTRTGVET